MLLDSKYPPNCSVRSARADVASSKAVVSISIWAVQISFCSRVSPVPLSYWASSYSTPPPYSMAASAGAAASAVL